MEKFLRDIPFATPEEEEKLAHLKPEIDEALREYKEAKAQGKIKTYSSVDELVKDLEKEE